MNIIFRFYQGTINYDGDYQIVCDFLKSRNANELKEPDFFWARFEWMFARASFDHCLLNKIGLWLLNDQIIALVTFEDHLGEAFIICDEAYHHLYPDLIKHAQLYFSHDGVIKILVPDHNKMFQKYAYQAGFLATTHKDENAIYDLNNLPKPTCDEQYKIISLNECPDFRKVNKVLWRGFNHEGDVPEDEESLSGRQRMFSSPHFNRGNAIVCVNDNNDFVSFAGSWYQQDTKTALLEPVATDPDYRGKGLGGKVVYETMRRCQKQGAKYVMVGSGQHFYYSLGFVPYSTSTWWLKKFG